jgi:uncharacterized protein (DUF2336 family)
LYSDLSPDDRAAAEGAMLLLLDDPSPLVRGAMAEVFAQAEQAPPAVVRGLAADQPEVAAPVLAHSPLLLDADLVDVVATARVEHQCAVARRRFLPAAVAAAIAEVGAAEACLVLIENPGAEIVVFSLDRIVARHGHLAAIRESLLARPDLPAATRQAVVIKLSETLAHFVTARAWMGGEQAQRIAHEACEKATVILAALSPDTEVRPLIRHLRETGQLTAGLILRALLSGNVRMFEEALADLSGLPLARVEGLVQQAGSGFRALHHKAGLPASTFAAFREAVEAMREAGAAGELGGSARLKRRMIERVLTRCEQEGFGDIEPLLMLLRRFATEAARDEARMFCRDLVAQDHDAPDADDAPALRDARAAA